MNIKKLVDKYEKVKQDAHKHSYMQMTDNAELTIECCKGVIRYDENCIKIRTAAHLLIIVGFDLCMKNFSSDGVIIRGRISSLTFENGDEYER